MVAWRMSLRFYKVALAASVALNVVLLAALWLYIHFAGLFSMIEDAVGFVN